MPPIHLSYVFMLFLAYSLIGWIWETSYCSIRHGHFINRGFLRGPLCPVYGFGGMLIMYLLQPWAHTWIPLFFASMVIVSVLEYFTGWLLETLFHTRWWDYSNEKFNLHGRIFLGGAICFGVMGTLIAHFLHPWLESRILSIPLPTARIIAWSLFAAFLLDLITTIRGLVDFTIYETRLKDFVESLRDRFHGEQWLEEKEQSLNQLFQQVRERLQEDTSRANQHLLEQLESLSQRQDKMLRHIRKFPTMRSLEFHQGVEALRHRVKEERQQRKAARSAKGKEEVF